MSKIINLEKNFAKKLGMRETAKKIFQDLEGESEATLNFEGIEFMSRSFAQEYVAQKYHSSININEDNMSDFVSGLLNVVEKDFKESCFS